MKTLFTIILAGFISIYGGFGDLSNSLIGAAKNAWNGAVEPFGRQIEKRLPDIDKEFNKQTETARIIAPKIAENIWETAKKLFYKNISDSSLFHK